MIVTRAFFIQPIMKAGIWLNPPSEKYAEVKLDHFPKDPDENKNYLKPPPALMSQEVSK